MDLERQPLLGPVASSSRNKYRALTHEEVMASRQELSWRRFRILLVLLFWGTIAMCISSIVCILITAPKCGGNVDLPPTPPVPPTHLSLAPLVSRGRMLNNNNDNNIYVM